MAKKKEPLTPAQELKQLTKELAEMKSDRETDKEDIQGVSDKIKFLKKELKEKD